MESFLRAFLPIYCIVYLLICFVWRAARVWKQTGINPLAFGNSDHPHDQISKYFRLLLGLEMGAVIAYTSSPLFYMRLGPVDFPLWVPPTGLGLLIISLIGCAVAQAQMGASWRVGIDARAKTAIVERGLFRYSRNPIYLSVMLSNLGFFLVIPNLATFFVLTVGYMLLQIQVRLEEQYMRSVHGRVYEDFCHRIRRWI